VARAVAVDGKTCRGARRVDGTRVHLLGVADHGGHLLDHLEVGVKHNETSHFAELLGPLDLAGAVVTFDALHTVRANLAWLVKDKKADYIAIVKRNQPLLHAQVRALPWRQVPGGGCARETGHGRAETRTVKTDHVSRLDFPGARQAIKITRWRQHAATGRTSRQTVYAVTSLTSLRSYPGGSGPGGENGAVRLPKPGQTHTTRPIRPGRKMSTRAQPGVGPYKQRNVVERTSCRYCD
jgi:hypothetical protein